MPHHYVVEIVDYKRDQKQSIIIALSKLLKTSPERIAQLLENLPRTVTKPLPQERAFAVQDQLRRLGIIAYSKFYAAHSYQPYPASSAKAIAEEARAPTPPIQEDSAYQLNAGENGYQAPKAASNYAQKASLAASPYPRQDQDPYGQDHYYQAESHQEPRRESPRQPRFSQIREAYQSLKQGYEPTPAPERTKRTRIVVKGLNLRQKASLASLLPAAFLAAGLLTSLWFLRPQLQRVLSDIAFRDAQVIVERLGGGLEPTLPLTHPTNRNIINGNLSALNSLPESTDLEFMAVADTQNNVISFWSRGSNYGYYLNPNLMSKLASLNNNSQASFDYGEEELLTRSQVVSVANRPVGKVYSGLKPTAIKANINELLQKFSFPILLSLLAVLLSALLVGELLTRNLNRLISRARKLRQGELHKSIEPESNDELKELAESLEHLRLELQDALSHRQQRAIHSK
ncbi:MAG: HAMP domain-containing protein [Deinococcales bacterium]